MSLLLQFNLTNLKFTVIHAKMAINGLEYLRLEILRGVFVNMKRYLIGIIILVLVIIMAVHNINY
ncbi:hypothetical protein [Natranaerobius thermophilus]|uniref:hypothetical protein n=1 Tax=Natranaerobius thermophilus TaxID=375929 RepID=UPI00130DBED5|nr:hypothetical protein [Natranaerobius thermophilus]